MEMGFFGGPSKKTLLVMAYGVAETVAQLQDAETIGGNAGEQILSEIEASGGPTTVQEVICYTVDVINENQMGSYKKNKFISMVYGSMIVAGVGRREAASIKAEIEIMSRSKERRRIKVLRSFVGGLRDEALFEDMVARSQKWHEVGGLLAQESYTNGLCRGECVKLSEIERLVKDKYAFVKPVMAGFMDFYKEYADKGMIIIQRCKDDDLVFIHEDYKNEYLK